MTYDELYRDALSMDLEASEVATAYHAAITTLKWGNRTDQKRVSETLEILERRVTDLDKMQERAERIAEALRQRKNELGEINLS